MSTGTAVLEHAVAFHDSLADLIRQVVPLVGEGRDRGDTVVLSLSPESLTALREVRELDDVVLLGLPDGPLSSCGQSTAVRRARDLEALTAAGPVTSIGQHDSRYDGADGRFWPELDAATHVAMAHLPIRMTCFYPRFPLHGVVLDGARRVHPLLREGARLAPNPEYRPPRDVLAGIPAPPPELLGVPHHELELSTHRLREVRALVERAMRDGRCSDDQTDDVVTAVNEIATNAVEHGRGPVRLAVWAGPDGCVVEVHDRGVLDDPLPGLTEPGPDADRGRGLWVARQASDYLRVWADETGTHVRVHVVP